MGQSEMIVWMICGCVLFILYVLFSRQFHAVFKMFLRGALGCAGIFLMNFLCKGFGLFVGINGLTAFMVGVLGLPGFVTLYAAQILL